MPLAKGLANFIRSPNIPLTAFVLPLKWDFQKYLIDENGKLVAEFDPKVQATGAVVSAAVER